MLAVPVTHCSPKMSDYQKQCYGGSTRDEIDCRIFPEDSKPHDIDFRNQVYFGQFRSIGESLSPSLSLSQTLSLYSSVIHIMSKIVLVFVFQSDIVNTRPQQLFYIHMSFHTPTPLPLSLFLSPSVL